MTSNIQVTTQWLIENGFITPRLYKDKGRLVFYYAILSQPLQLRTASTRSIFQKAIDAEVKGKAKMTNQSIRKSLLTIPLPANFLGETELKETAVPIPENLSKHIHREEEVTLIDKHTPYLKIFVKRTCEGVASIIFRFNFFDVSGKHTVAEREQVTINPADDFVDMVAALKLVSALQPA